MGSRSMLEKPYVLCIPFLAQGHINPMLKLVKLLHRKDFRITFINTEFNHKRILKSRGPNSLDGFLSFRFDVDVAGLAFCGHYRHNTLNTNISMLRLTILLISQSNKLTHSANP
ncbi:hypothetical protein ACSBR2_038116 [Camellia fascicularis]